MFRRAGISDSSASRSGKGIGKTQTFLPHGNALVLQDPALRTPARTHQPPILSAKPAELPPHPALLSEEPKHPQPVCHQMCWDTPAVSSPLWDRGPPAGSCKRIHFLGPELRPSVNSFCNTTTRSRGFGILREEADLHG